MIWFVLAAGGELVGCYALWVWLRDGRSPLLILLAIASLLFFAWCLSRTPVQFAGRAARNPMRTRLQFSIAKRRPTR